MNYRINRRVSVDGVSHWIHANNEQDYCNKIVSISRGNAPEQKQRHNFRDYALEWFNVYSVPNVSTATAACYDRQLTNYLLPAFGDMDVEDIRVSDLQQLFNSINGAKATKDKVKMVLNQILESAVDDDIIDKNPLKSSRLKIEGNVSKDTPPYSVEEMQYLAAHIDDIQGEQDRLYLALQMFHPLRLEEVLGLQWQDVDIDNKRLYIRRAVTHPTRNQPEVKEPKTEQSKRVIGLSGIASRYLASATVKSGYIIGGDSPLSYTAVRRMCERIQRETQFNGKITPIRFRTTVLTDLYDTTKDIKLTQQTAGHATSAMTLKHYVKGREIVTSSATAIDQLYTGKNCTFIAPAQTP
ncbi:MAG: site-specific integrase [Clostridia bacterium]|nr:site-specific integrase [Clostridia bacterium]